MEHGNSPLIWHGWRAPSSLFCSTTTRTGLDEKPKEIGRKAQGYALTASFAGPRTPMVRTAEVPQMMY